VSVTDTATKLNAVQVGEHRVFFGTRWLSTACRTGLPGECEELGPTSDGWIACSHSSHSVAGLADRLERLSQLLVDRPTAPQRAAVRPTRASVARPASRTRPCTCECGEMTGGGRFLPGHDSRLKSRLVQAARTKTGDEKLAAQERLNELGWGHYL
jgi:hypothetical protein